MCLQFLVKQISLNPKIFDTETFPYLYKSIVLEYGNHIWGQFYLLDQQKLERVQRKATKSIKEISQLQYEERLSFLKLPS